MEMVAGFIEYVIWMRDVEYLRAAEKGQNILGTIKSIGAKNPESENENENEKEEKWQ